MNGASSKALEVLARFRGDRDSANELIKAVHAHLRACGSGAVITVGCSPAVRQERLVSDIVRSLPDGDQSGRVLTVIAPPVVTSVRSQVRVLHDRYLAAGGCLQLRYRHQPKHPVPAVVRTTEEEALNEFLRTRHIACVVVMHGELLIDDGGAIGNMARIVRHLADIARCSGVPHVVVGSRPAVLACANLIGGVNRVRLVLQRIYDPGTDDGVEQFARILNAYQESLGPVSAVVLASRTKRLMARVGGDPVRMAQWLCDALCAAAQRAEKLAWGHLSATGPRLPEINDANRDLAGYLAWMGFDPLADISSDADKSDVRTVTGTTPGQRKPGRDSVPRARTAA